MGLSEMEANLRFVVGRSGNSTIASLALCFFILPGSVGRAAQWKGGVGDWEDAAAWGGTLPSQRNEATVNGTKEKPSRVTLAKDSVIVNHLSVADGGNSAASLTLDGPSLTVIGTADIGKYDGSDGLFALKSGSVFAGTFFLSGGGGPGQRGRGTVEIHGGSVVTKDIEMGVSAGCTSTLRVVGSKAKGIFIEDGLHTGVYNYLSLEKEPPPSAAELIFEIDGDGVTPIFTWGKTEGRVYFPVPDEKRNGVGTCRLQIRLLAAPPVGDMLLIGSANSCRGNFTDLAEGDAVRAAFGGKTYEWKLTYRGGSNHCDIMLTDPHVASADGTMSPHVSGKPKKEFRFDRAVVEAAYREFYRQSDAQQAPFGGRTPAFPGAEGYGAFAKGGRGGRILLVTNLNDSGPGSLREAVESKGPRMVIFRVGGVIETTGLIVREPYLTIAGQSAPGDGICIKKADIGGDAFQLSSTHDVVVRFLRVRAGNNTGKFRCDTLRVYDSDSFIIDHCSCSWGNPETLSASGSSDRYTVQWCINSEGNNEQAHAFACIIGGNRSTWHHNLYAHMFSRVPRWGDITVQCDFRNNVIYDWGHTCGYGDMRTLNYVNNYARRGPSTTQNPPYFIIDPKVVLPGSLYLDGNVMAGFADIGRDNWKGVKADRRWQSETAFSAPPVQTQTAEGALELVLNRAGATLPRRDPADTRVVSEVRDGTGKIIKSEQEVGGWPNYASGEPATCTANDGIPDSWKQARGLSLSDTNVANTVNAEGYTTLEVYLNSLVGSE